MPDKKHKYKDDDNAREKHDDTQGNRNARVTSQPQRSPKKGEARGKATVRFGMVQTWRGHSSAVASDRCRVVGAPVEPLRQWPNMIFIILSAQY